MRVLENKRHSIAWENAIQNERRSRGDSFETDSNASRFSQPERFLQVKSKARHTSKEDGELELESPNSQVDNSTPSSTGKSGLKFNMK